MKTFISRWMGASEPDPIRTQREVLGSIFLLGTLFETVALVSYLPTDGLHLLQQRWNHVHNLGGLVGAAFSELLLGSLGLVGAVSIVISLWAAFLAFRGIPLRSQSRRFLSFLPLMVLSAVFVNLMVGEYFPEASLLQGGWVGRTLGHAFSFYLHPTGAALITLGLLLIATFVTFGISPSELLGMEAQGLSEQPAMVPIPAVRTTPRAPALVAAPKKRRKKAAPAAGEPKLEEGETPDTESEVPLESKGGGFQPLLPFLGQYDLPSARLLKNASENHKLSRKEIGENAQKLTQHLLSFEITGEIVAVSQGPVLTTYEYKPSAGIKLKAIANLQEDLGVVLGTRELRIIAPIPGKTVVGIEVPKPKADTIPFKEIILEKQFQDKKLKLPIAIGKTTDGRAFIGDLASMPHLLVAGSTGSGKSVFINSLILSFIYRMTPQELRLILVDPKMLELSVFEGIPHLLAPVITQNEVAFNALNWAVEEMERRYALMAQTGSKNIESYNSKINVKSEKLPFLVIVVDELADLMMSGGDIVEVAITRLAQKARAAGIHLVIATQRPSTDVITGLIKANIPSRIAFKVPSSIDSRTVLDTSGAEELIGRGDGLILQAASPLQRFHGCFVSEEELHRVVKAIRTRNFSGLYLDFTSGGGTPSEE